MSPLLRFDIPGVGPLLHPGVERQAGVEHQAGANRPTLTW
jgi:hypothetical protein